MTSEHGLQACCCCCVQNLTGHRKRDQLSLGAGSTENASLAKHKVDVRLWLTFTEEGQVAGRNYCSLYININYCRISGYLCLAVISANAECAMDCGLSWSPAGILGVPLHGMQTHSPQCLSTEGSSVNHR